MATVEDLVSALNPSVQDEEKRRALMAMGLFGNLIGARRGQEGQALQRGLFGGLEMGQNWEDNRRKSAMQGLQARGTAYDLLNKEDAYNQNLRYNKAMAEYAPTSPMQQAMSEAPSLSPTVDNVANVTARAQQVGQGNGQYERLLGLADFLDKRGLPQKAMEFRTLAEKFAPQYEGMETVMQDGKPVLVQRFKNRPAQVIPGMEPKPDIALTDLGGTTQAIDKLRATNGQSWNRTPQPFDPRGKVSISDFTPDSYQRWITNGTTDYSTLVPFDRASKINIDNKPLTESQGNASMYLGMMRGASQELASLGIVPNQFSVALAKNEFPVIPAIVQNSMAGPEAQRYAQAAEQWTEAALRITTGATAPPEEVKRMARIYFPQPGDSPQRMAQKERMRSQVEDLVAIKASPAGASQVGKVVDQAQGAAPQQPAASMMPRPKSAAEVEALPSGTVFIAPDGKQKVKP